MAIRPTSVARLGRILLTALLSLAFVTGSVYLLREPLLVSAIRIALHDAGVQIHDIQGVQMRANSLHLDRVHFALPGAASGSSLEDVQVEFSPQQLLQGQVEVLHIRQAALVPATSSTPGETSSIASTMAQALALLMQFPISQVRIESLELKPWMSSAHIEIASQPRGFTTVFQEGPVRAEVRANWHDKNFVSSYFIPETELSVRALATDSLTVNLFLDYEGDTALSMDLSILQAGNDVILDMDVRALLDTLTQVAAGTGVDIAAMTGLSGQLDAKVSASVSSSADTPHQFSLQLAPTQLVLPWQNQRIAVQVESLSLRGQCMTLRSCTLHQASSLMVTSDAAPGLFVGNADSSSAEQLLLNGLQLQSTAEVQLDEDSLRVMVQAGSAATLDFLRLGTLEAQNVRLLAVEPLTAEWNRADAWSVQGNDARLRLPALHSNDLEVGAEVTFNNFSATGTLTDMDLVTLNADSHWQSLTSNALPFVLKSPAISATVMLSDDVISVNGTLQIASRRILDAEVAYDVARSEGTVALRIPDLLFDQGAGSFGGLFMTSTLPGDILAGSISASALLRLTPASSGNFAMEGPVRLLIQELSGFAGETAIVGASLDAEAELLNGFALRTSRPAQLNIASIDPGIAMQDIKALLDIDTAANTLSVANIEAKMFSGSVRSDGGLFTLDSPQGTLQLQLERINLADILRLSAYEGVAASGLISGSLPVSLQAGALSIAGGTLFAEFPGGNIRYGGTGETGGNAALDFVNQTLSNYQYDLMEAGVDYQPNGDLTLAVKLQGVNPGTNPGQRINLNLNISDNIPTLLRSLQAGRTITEAVERQLQSR